MTDAFTLEGNAQFTQGLRNVGIGGLLRLSHFGVINAALSTSGGDDSGTQLSAGYQYLSPHFNLSVQGIRTRDAYRDIGSTEGSSIPERQWYASVSVPIAQRHSLTLAHARQQASRLGGSNILTLGYSGTFGSRVNVFANVFRDSDRSDSLGLFIGGVLSLGQRTSVSASASRYGTERTVAMSANRSVDYDTGGFGWNALLDGGDDDYRHALARLDYLGRYGEASLQVEHSKRGDDAYTLASLFATGAVVYMDGDLLASRQIYDGFALVSAGGLTGVPVRRENRLVGTTNDEGHLLIPDLLSWRTNRLSMDTADLPLDVLTQADRIEVAPRAQSGVLARFPVERYGGATVILLDDERHPLPVGTIVTLLDTGETAVVGYDGQAFLPRLQATNPLSAATQYGTCQVTVPFAVEDTMRTIGPFICTRQPPP